MSRPVTAHGTLNGQKITAPVINPGDWFGKTWLIAVSMGFEASYFVVEADSPSDAIDEFADNDTYGHLVKIEEREYRDYAFAVGKGDMIGGEEFDRAGWVDLNGKFYDTDPKLPEPQTSGCGTQYDTDNLFIHGIEGIQNGKGMPWPCTYSWEGMPQWAAALTPLEFEAQYDQFEESLES